MLFKQYLVALAAMMAPIAQADEADWLYFPMYSRDTAHAVHLSKLQFRPDGLLASASRYPRHSGEPWTEAESEKGWYNYDTRLIDCETGFHVETGSWLLDQQNQPIASREPAHADWLVRLIQQLKKQDRKWPDHSEIALACLGASNPAIKQERAKQTLQAQPLISYAPLTAKFKDETGAIFNTLQFRFDISTLGKQPPANAHAVFSQLHSQFIGWRQRIDRNFKPSDDTATRRELQTKLNQKLVEIGAKPNQIRVVGAGLIEYEQDWQPEWGIKPPANAKRAVAASQTIKEDCSSGIAIPIARQWLDENGKTLATAPVAVKPLLEQLVQQYGQEQGFTINLLENTNANSEQCRLVAALSTRAPTPATTQADEETQPTMLFGLDEATLRQEKSPEAMLLKIRAAWRAQQVW
ncbi:hypothetical protein [Chitinivorax sp. B]|uniref:hypothetical protein n=1 Tax=Chitinivorax sp. B TaxID=2502235 RepID=UPI0010F6297F|nr:hypothetical protein [Chitinivorax sp. B]